MIELSFDEAIILYLFFLVLPLILVWYFNRKPKVKLAPKHLVICEFCDTPLMKRVNDPYGRCPNCGSLTNN